MTESQKPIMGNPLFPSKSLRIVSPVIVLVCFLAITIYISSSASSYASSPGIDFYSVGSPPPGIRSLEPLIGK